MTRVKLLLALCSAALAGAALVPGAAAAADGVSVTVSQPGDNLLHIDIKVTYTGSGAGLYDVNYGVGTFRATLPGVDAANPPRFAPVASDPGSYSCRVVTGADEAANTGYECSTPGMANLGATALQFPTEVTMHLVANKCYGFPALSAKPPARADVWAAPDETNEPPDATYQLLSDTPCTLAPPASQKVADVKVRAKKCTVPSLEKLTLKKAKQKLEKAGCKPGKLTHAYSKTIKKGRVISQSPKAKKKVRRGTKVKLKLSKGAKKKR